MIETFCIYTVYLTRMIVIEKTADNENQTIQIKKSISTTNMVSQYQIKKTPSLVRQDISWKIPQRYYSSYMDPVKAFLYHNTIQNYTTRLYWQRKSSPIHYA